jgi:hypothetical protein
LFNRIEAETVQHCAASSDEYDQHSQIYSALLSCYEKEAMVMNKSPVILIALALVFGAVVSAHAQGPPAGPQRYCSIFLIFPATPRTIEGTVTGYGPLGGMVVDNGTSAVTIYGLGPIWYWAAEGVDSPDIGDIVAVDARDVEFLNGTRTIAVSITIDGQTIALRDSATGCPLWRGGRRGR